MSDFAKLVIEVDSTGAVTAKKVLGDLGAEAGKTETKTKTMGEKFRDLQAVMQGPVAAFNMAKAAITQVAQTMDSFIMAGAEAQQSVSAFNSVLRATGGVAGYTGTQMRDLADELFNTTLFDDEQILDAETALMRFQTVTGKAFEETIRISADFAQATGQDVVSVTTNLARAFKGEEEGITMLRRAGVILTDTQVEMTKALYATGDAAGAQSIILSELRGQTNGAAQDAANAATGGYLQLKMAIDDTTESFGLWLAETMDGFKQLKDITKTLGASFEGQTAYMQVQKLISGEMILKGSENWKAVLGPVKEYLKLVEDSEKKKTGGTGFGYVAGAPKLSDEIKKSIKYLEDQIKLQEYIEGLAKQQADFEAKKADSAERSAKAAEDEAHWRYQIAIHEYAPSLAERKSMGILAEESPAEAVLDRERELGIAIANNNELSKEYNVTLEVSTADMKTMGGAVEKLARHMYDLTEAEKRSNAAYADLEKTITDFGAGVLFDASSEFFNVMGEAIGGSTTAAQDMADTMRDLGQSIMDELPRLMFYAGVKMLEVNPELGIALMLGSGLVALGSGLYRAGMESSSGSSPSVGAPASSMVGGNYPVSVSIINQSGVALQGEVTETRTAGGGRSLELTVKQMVSSAIASGGADSALRLRPNGRSIPLRRG